MKLEKLLQNVDVISTNADMNTEVTSIKISSKEVEHGDMYEGMEGANDAHTK